MFDLSFETVKILNINYQLEQFFKFYEGIGQRDLNLALLEVSGGCFSDKSDLPLASFEIRGRFSG